jgi:hypothetical protein
LKAIGTEKDMYRMGGVSAAGALHFKKSASKRYVPKGVFKEYGLRL